MTFDRNSIDKFPAQPGVYVMKGKKEAILYVGKAKNLRQRVRQYFISGGDGREMIPALVSQIETIETIVVLSEKEALLLENTLIKNHQPKYNALLKDDKSYISLMITTKDQWPTIRLVRYKGKPKGNGLYFGPYTSAYSARQTLDLLNKVFPLRQCSDQELIRRTRPCILYDMKRCIAPCVNRCTKEEYDNYVSRAVKFLRGRDQEVIDDLYQEMHRASQELEFERAALILTSIRALERTFEAQHVHKVNGKDTDVFGIYREGHAVMVCQLLYRHGKLVGNNSFIFSDLAQDDEELLSSLMLQHYEAMDNLPHEVLLPIRLADSRAVEEILCGMAGKNVELIVPQRGDKARLIEIAVSNAKANYQREHDAKAVRERMLLEMEEKLRLNRFPRRIECFDNSNIQGAEPVSALVTFTDGERDTKRYRLYKIRSTTTPDDYATMQEVLTRRYKRAKETNDLPDLLIVDGGKGHLNIAMRVLSELDISTVDVIGVAKEEGRHDRGVTQEQIFLPNVKDPILLRPTSPVIFLLQRIRDEAHRSAIQFHRKRRSKGTIKSQLDEIAGIGPAKKKALLKTFGSLKGIRDASEEELKKVTGISKVNVDAIRKALFKSSQ